MLVTNPHNLPVLLLMVPFVLFFFGILLAVFRLSFVFVRGPMQVSARSKRLIYSFLIAGYPVALLLLQSIGQLTLRDVITLTLLCAVFALYVTRNS